MNEQAAMPTNDYLVTPASLPEAQDMREAAIIELAKVSSQLGRAKGGMREFLKAESEKIQARLRGLNTWIANECGARGSATRPSKEWLTKQAIQSVHAATHRMAIPVMPNLPERAAGAETVCSCGETVSPQRGRDSFLYYCQNCGRDWSEPAPRIVVKPKPRPVTRRCMCAVACRYCGGRKR